MAAAATCVFVYGTLMPGQSRWPSLEPYATTCTPATATGRLWDTGRGYPAIRFDADGEPVPGVLVALAPDRVGAAIARLDDIEGEGVLYRRVRIVTSGGPAISYEWAGPTDAFTRLPGGWPSSRQRCHPDTAARMPPWSSGSV